MHSDIILSVIMPVYNIEKYLTECIESVINIKYLDNIEIIIIDDGSKDKSGMIADKYADRFEFISVFHKKNGGLSDARNYGLHKSKGKFVLFLDPDDLVDSKTFNELFGMLFDFEEDIVLWDAVLINEQSEILQTEESKYYIHNGLIGNNYYNPYEIIMNQLRDHNDFVTTVWLGLYRREYLLENNLWFEKGILHEDELWTPKALLNANKIYYYRHFLYKYRIRENSIMQNKSLDKSKNVTSLIYIFETLSSFYIWKVKNKDLRDALQANLAKRYLHKITEYDMDKYKEYKSNINRLNILKNAKGCKDKVRATILIISVKIYCFVSKKYVTMRK